MQRIMAAAVVASSMLAGLVCASAQDLFRPLTPAQVREFEACMYAAWVEDYCESTYWTFPRTSPRVRACVRANSGDRFPVEHHFPYRDEDYCRAAVLRPYR
jgi:hypothetical protein